MTNTPQTTEFQNRVEEVLVVDAGKIYTSRQIQGFVGKLVHVMEFIYIHPVYKKRFDILYENKKLQDLRSRLLEKGDELLTFVSAMFDVILESLPSSLKLPTEKEILQKYRKQSVFTMTVDENLGWTIQRMKKSLRGKNNPSDRGLESLVFDMHHMQWDFETLGIDFPVTHSAMTELDVKTEEFKELKEEYEDAKKYFGLSAYYLIKGVWEWKHKKGSSMGQIRFLLSPLGILATDRKSGKNKPTREEIEEDVREYQDAVRAIQKRFEESFLQEEYTFHKQFFNYMLQFLPDLIRSLLPGKK